MPQPARTIQLFPADEIPERGRDDSLIAALIEKLPPPGTRWPAVERKAWLDMMATAFVVLYGGPAGGGMTDAIPARTRPASARSRKPARKAAAAPRKKPAATGNKPKPTSLAPLEPDFYIDKDGFARTAGGARILPGDVGDVLVDLRGEGDLGTIIWADDTQGIKGYQLDIQAA